MNNDRFTALLRRAISRRENKEASAKILGDLEEAIRILEEEKRIYDSNDALNRRDAKFAVAGVDPMIFLDYSSPQKR